MLVPMIPFCLQNFPETLIPPALKQSFLETLFSSGNNPSKDDFLRSVAMLSKACSRQQQRACPKWSCNTLLIVQSSYEKMGGSSWLLCSTLLRYLCLYSATGGIWIWSLLLPLHFFSSALGNIWERGCILCHRVTYISGHVLWDEEGATVSLRLGILCALLP